MLTLIKKIIMSILVLGTLSVFGQAKLGIINITFPDTVEIGQSYNFSAIVKNQGNQPFSGTIDLDYQSDSMITFQLVGSIDSIANNIIPTNQPLQPGDSLEINPKSFFIVPGSFKSNFTNIVVVWPRAIGALTGDSATVTTYVQAPSSILNSVNYNSTFISFPNPFSEKIEIYSKSKKQFIQNVTIFDCTGKICFVGKPIANTIDTHSLSKGIYIIEVLDNENNVSRSKIIKD